MREEIRNQLLELMGPEDLNRDMQLVSQIIGMEKVRRMVAELGGGQYYINKVNYSDELIKRYILTFGVGKSVKSLARLLEKTPRKIRELLEELDMCNN